MRTEKTPAASQQDSRCFALRIRREHEKEKEKNKKQQKNCCQKRKVIDFSAQK